MNDYDAIVFLTESKNLRFLFEMYLLDLVFRLDCTSQCRNSTEMDYVLMKFYYSHLLTIFSQFAYKSLTITALRIHSIRLHTLYILIPSLFEFWVFYSDTKYFQLPNSLKKMVKKERKKKLKIFYKTFLWFQHCLKLCQRPF